VVVGHYKPAIVLCIEPLTPLAEDSGTAIAELKSTVIERMKGFTTRLFPHERITYPEQIVIVEAGSLPRTQEKGNIR
jgi:hypothetical protein